MRKSFVRCRTCVMPTSRPDTHFDETGQCSACSAFERRKTIDWDLRRQELIRLLAENYDASAPFDCVVPSSGGKDSTWQVLKLLELGARPLVVTATTCHLTPIGRHNIDNLARYATTIEVSPNKTVRAKLNRLGLELVGDISWPEHVSIFTIPQKIAAAHKIPLIFYGENPQSEYGGPPGSQEGREMTRRWVSEFGGFLGLRPQDLVGTEGLTLRDISDYLPNPAQPTEAVFKPEAYFLGQFFPWDSHQNAEVAIKAGMQTGTKPPCVASYWLAENLDNAHTAWHDHMMFRKYGYGRLAAQVSVDVRNGRMDREIALKLVQERDGLFTEVYAGVSVEEVLDRIGMTRERLFEIMDHFTNLDIMVQLADEGQKGAQECLLRESFRPFLPAVAR